MKAGSRLKIKVGQELLEDFSKQSRGTSNPFTGKAKLIEKYQGVFQEHLRMLGSDDVDDLDRATKLFLDYLLLVEDESQCQVIVGLNILPRIIELFMVDETPAVCETCVSILAELQYWKPLPMNDDLANALVRRCIYLFEWGDQELNFSILVLIQNLCCDYPRFSNMFLDCALFIEYYHFFEIDMKWQQRFLDQLGVTSLAVVRNPFNPANVSQVVCIVNQWMRYPHTVSVKYALRIVQTLSAQGFRFPFTLDDVEMFEAYSASRDKQVVVECLRTLTSLKDDEFVERCLTDCFLDNLAIQIFKGRKDDIVGYIFKFLRYILPFTKPISNDLIVPITCVSISKRRFCCVYYGMKFLRDVCRASERFAADLCGIGVCSLAAPSLAALGQTKVGDVAADLLVLIGGACQKHGIDITAAFGYDRVIEAIADIDLECLSRDHEAKLHDIELYFNVM